MRFVKHLVDAGANRLYIEEYVIRHRDGAASAGRPLPKMAAA